MDSKPIEPKGVEFFNIKTGETHFPRLEPTITAYINSSDLGINASRGQDFGWRLGKSWVTKVRSFKRDELKMERLMEKNSGREPSTAQILHTIYGEEMRAYHRKLEQNEAPFEQAYLDSIREDEPNQSEERVAVEADRFDELYADEDGSTEVPEVPEELEESKPAKPGRPKKS